MHTNACVCVHTHIEKGLEGKTTKLAELMFENRIIGG